MSKYVIVKDGMPKAIDSKMDAITAYLEVIDKSPNVYQFDKKLNTSEYLSEALDNDGKITFYGFTEYSAPTAVAVYVVNDDYNEIAYYNKAAMEDQKNNEQISSMTANRNEYIDQTNFHKIICVGDFIEMSNGTLGRVDVVNKNSLQVNFDDTTYHITTSGRVGRANGTLGACFQKPKMMELASGARRFGKFWMSGTGWEGQGNKRLDVMLATNTWKVIELIAM